MSLPLPLQAIARRLGMTRASVEILSDLERFTTALDAELEAASSGLELPCRRGCDACCHESVFLSAPEFLRVIESLSHTRSRADFDSILEQMLQLADDFSEDFEMLESFDKGPERDEVAARVRFRCPLLGTDGACTVYAAREINGRSFGRTTDAERDEAYGCELTHERLRVIGEVTLPDARDIRRRLTAAVAEAQSVRTYPQWFAIVQDLLR